MYKNFKSKIITLYTKIRYKPFLFKSQFRDETHVFTEFKNKL